MLTPNGNTTARRSEQASEPAHPADESLVSLWGRGRRRITPWAYPRLRALAAVRFTIGIFLVGLGALTLSQGHAGWAALLMVSAVLLFSIAYLDITVARSATPRA